MTSISYTKPFSKCPDKILIQSEVVNSNLMYQDQSACLSAKPLFNDADLRQKCQFSKTQQDCMDHLRSQGIFKNLNSQSDLVHGKCGSLEVLANSLNFCTDGMHKLTSGIISNSSSPGDQQTMAREISQVCQFENPVPRPLKPSHCAPWESE